MLPNITDTQPNPSTSRATTTDRDGTAEETSTGLGSCWFFSRWLRRSAAPEVAPGRASEFMGTVDRRSLQQRTIQAPCQVAQSAAANLILREILTSHRVPLRLKLPEYSSNTRIDFDIVWGDGCISLKLGTKFRAYYLAKAENDDRSTIKLPLPLRKDPGVPTYLLTPGLRGEAVGIELSEDEQDIIVYRQKLTPALRRSPAGQMELNASMQTFMLLPNNSACSAVDSEAQAFCYRRFPELGQRENEAPDNQLGQEVVLWGQLEGENYYNMSWCFSLQHNAAKDDEFEIITISMDDKLLYGKSESTLIKSKPMPEPGAKENS